VPFDRTRVEGINLRGLDNNTGRLGDLVGEGLNGAEVVSGEVERRPFPGEGLRNGTADRAGGTVDDGGLALEQHHVSFVV
jgi:hypothetical protein